MSKETERQYVRERIIKLREKGYSYKIISERLLAEDGIKMTRQNVHQIYSRIMGLNKLKESNGTAIDVGEQDLELIIKLWAYGAKPNTVMQVLRDAGCELNKNQVRTIIMEYSDSIVETRHHTILDIEELLRKGCGVEQIIEMLSFDGYTPNLDIIGELLSECDIDHRESIRLRREYKERLAKGNK